ncbi:undecaprenyl-diphosphate phosphatase [Marinihelvus fidelis]|uniref:Undecaprenyl-diphosphatase n=1 Tax=Marinihelvus fidelis TaxID=2613842 RepID=A0A5N0TB13_9GAMM|nr:undecaprenyl-diphosphate phosphatase [Marinihelvus fidelis]KAA9131337.1 undecaprenyl-diphosphate phosphatase [Marinihelvus fidelis]
MTALQVVVLAIVQGLTEFLPVSSSAHLVLVGQLAGWEDQGLVLDVAAHLGTLLAVVAWFHRDLLRMAAAVFGAGPGERVQQDRRLALTLLTACLPVLLVGALAFDAVSTYLRDIRVVAATTLIFGVLLWIADRFAPANKAIEQLGLRPGLAIGVAQVLALVPGVSRSGITITMARALGFDALSAARFSFLLSIPVIAAAGLFGAWEIASGAVKVPWGAFWATVILSAAAGWACISVFLALLERVGLTPFVIYRLVLGVALLAVIYSAP